MNMYDFEPHGMANGHGIGELPDTGVTNGRLTPGRAALMGAWIITALVFTCPLFF